MTDDSCQVLCLENRNILKMNGVKNVQYINTNEACVFLNNDALKVNGENLKAEKLCVETGELVIVGKINSIKYEQKKEKQSFFKRIIK